jgi:hypothetical protein
MQMSAKILIYVACAAIIILAAMATETAFGIHQSSMLSTSHVIYIFVGVVQTVLARLLFSK